MSRSYVRACQIWAELWGLEPESMGDLKAHQSRKVARLEGWSELKGLLARQLSWEVVILEASL